MKLVVSFHRRGNIVPEFESDPEESQNDQEPSETGSSDLSYKEEFELELGSYEIQSSESTSTSSTDTGEEDGSTRKRAEMLDNYEIAEIGHGRRKFMPKARPGTLDSTFFGTPIEQKAPPLGSHPLKVSTTGIRKERRRSALKAHRDFLYAAKNSSAAYPESEEDDLIAKAVESILTKHAGLSVDSHSEKPTLEGSNTCERVQIAVNGSRTQASLLGPQLERNSSNLVKSHSESSTNENSIAEDNRSLEANVQKADCKWPPRK